MMKDIVLFFICLIGTIIWVVIAIRSGEFKDWLIAILMLGHALSSLDHAINEVK